MSVHDETWDKCPKCKQTIKTWHGDFHDSGGCLDYVSFHKWEEERKFIMGYESKTSIEKKNLIPESGPTKSTDKTKSPFDDWNTDPSNLMFPKVVNPDSKPLPPFYGSSMFPKINEYQPEMIAVEKDFLLCDLKLVIEAGLEYTQECLSRHDLELGRTTRKNESWAKIMEQDIEKMKQVLKRIAQYENP